MNTKELSERLNGCEYMHEVSKGLEAQAKENGIVIVFGGSDDLVEFRGAIYDELDVYGERIVYVSSHGLCVDNCGYDCPDNKLEKIKEKAKTIKVTFDEWDNDGTWTYQTDIPHETFEVMENGELFCRGIVFYLEDAK